MQKLLTSFSSKVDYLSKPFFLFNLINHFLILPKFVG